MAEGICEFLWRHNTSLDPRSLWKGLTYKHGPSCPPIPYNKFRPAGTWTQEHCEPGIRDRQNYTGMPLRFDYEWASDDWIFGSGMGLTAFHAQDM